MAQKIETYIGRFVVVATSVVALLAGLLPVLANLDLESTAGIITGIIAVAQVVKVWLVNRGQYESVVTQAEAQAHVEQFRYDLVQKEARDRAAREDLLR